VTMARRLPVHLSHKSALALLPPSSITPPIEAVRRVHDKHFARWPPHLNLIYPFLASPSQTTEQGNESGPPRLKEEIRVRIEKVTKNIQPFHVSLNADPPGTFSRSKRSQTVWLGPSTQSVQQLHAALQTEFTDCDSDQRPFTPHLSVGQARSDKEVQVLSEEIKKSVFEYMIEHDKGALDWHVDTVYVIERKGFHDRFKVVGAIELGK
ncbi:hypothetical protein P153DRAFT_252649, partial [Dothidotthia symphoricarpi CBS 119687]